MHIAVLADADWTPDLESAFAEHRLTRVQPEGDLPADADLLIATASAMTPWVESRGSLELPTLLVVPRTVERGPIDRLVASAPRCQVLFEPVDGAALVRAAASIEAEGEPGPAQEGGTGGKAGARESMGQLWEKFRGTMLQRLDVLERVGADLLEEEADEASVEEAEHAAHKLHGSLGTFGLTRGSELAAEVEAIVEGGVPKGGEIFRYSELVVALRDEIERGRAQGVGGSTDDGGDEGRGGRDRMAEAATGAEVPDAPSMLIVEPDADRADRLAAAALARGWRPEVVADVEAGREAALSLAALAVVVIDPQAGSDAALESLMSALEDQLDPPPVVFHVADRSQEERLRAVSLGAEAFVDKGAAPSLVMNRAEALVEADDPAAASVLVVDDDEAVLEVVPFILRGAGFQVRTLRDPLDFWQTLEEAAPDLLLLDVDMPRVSGYQLCRAVRADPRWEALPVLFLTAKSDSTSVIRGFEAGADDFIAKPVVGPELTARVEARLERRGGRERAPAGKGLLERGPAMERLEVQLALAARYGDVVSAAVLRLADTEEGGAPQALESTSRALVDASRAEDVVARSAGRELLVVRYGEGANATRQWLTRVAPLPIGTAIQVGVAEFPGEDTAAALVDAARNDVAANGSRAGSGETAPAPQAEADIVVVEDDESLGTLLIQTLDDRGYDTHWLQDGAEAADVLTGERPALRASLIILDVGLPGMDGLTLLRQLRKDGVTRRTKVLMLTARSAESEVVRALELGAFDHVPKPFSVTELLHRVKRALGTKSGS